jgi:amino acid transporter
VGAAAAAAAGRSARALPAPLIWGFAVSSIGGPLALLAIELPDAVGGRALDSTGLVVAAGAALFAAPMLIWWRFSADIASAGGLYAFTAAALGRRVALVQGALWVLSYLLYLAFTVTQVVYDLLPLPFPGIGPWKGVIEVALPTALAIAVVSAERAVLWALAAMVLAQVAGTAALGVAMLAHSPAPGGSFTVGVHPGSVARGIADASLLFVCASLPLFLGGEVAGGGRALRRIVAGAAAAVAVLLVATAFPLAHYAGSSLASLELPGQVVAQDTSGDSFATWISAGAIASVLGLVIAEFIALTRLLHAMSGQSVRRAGIAVGTITIAADVLSLIDPETIYDRMITPSLVALYLSQLVVFAGYGVYARRRRGLTALDAAAVLISCGLMLFGLEVVISQQSLV